MYKSDNDFTSKLIILTPTVHAKKVEITHLKSKTGVSKTNFFFPNLDSHKYGQSFEKRT